MTEQGDNKLNAIIKKAQLNIEIKYVKERIEYHRRTIHQLQAMGIGLTDQLNNLEKEITIKMSFPLMTENMEKRDHE